MASDLLPCPFCGCALDAQWNRPNPKARCRTEGCKGGQLPVLNLDVPEDIAAWNTRAVRDPIAWRIVAFAKTGEVVGVGEKWHDGKPSAEYLAYLAGYEGWTIEYAYAGAPGAVQRPTVF